MLASSWQPHIMEKKSCISLGHLYSACKKSNVPQSRSEWRGSFVTRELKVTWIFNIEVVTNIVVEECRCYFPIQIPSSTSNISFKNDQPVTGMSMLFSSIFDSGRFNNGIQLVAEFSWPIYIRSLLGYWGIFYFLKKFYSVPTRRFD